jgi:hypothetical protein
VVLNTLTFSFVSSLTERVVPFFNETNAQVILEHIPHYTHTIIKTSPMLKTNCFGDCDLDMVDEIPIPQRLEDRIGKTGYQYVLHGLLPKVMIDSVNLVFREYL